jgi:oligopeptide/dipeptide ABC transporter ATP-binding protein
VRAKSLAPATAAPSAARVGSAGTDVVLDVRDLTVEFPSHHGWIQPVRSVSFELRRGTRLGLVGESGSGKSLSALSLMRLVPPPGRVSGEVLLGGVDLLRLSERQMSHVRGRRIAMVYQDPMSALNPVFSVGRQIIEAVRLARGVDRKTAAARAVDLLGEVGVPDPKRRMDSYPHEFSGGMRQRVVIAMALAGDPDVVVADEPTTALDVTTQAKVMSLFSDLVDRHDVAVVLITHDMGVAASFCDEINVMYAGRVVERAPIEPLFSNPLHPYTEGLLSSICRMDHDVSVRISAVPGQPPLPGQLPAGCSFSPRCSSATPTCHVQVPVPVTLGIREAECLYARERLAASGVEGGDFR